MQAFRNYLPTLWLGTSSVTIKPRSDLVYFTFLVCLTQICLCFQKWNDVKSLLGAIEMFFKSNPLKRIPNWKFLFNHMPFCKFFIMSTEFDKNISNWSYDCSALKNDIDFFMRLVKWPKIAIKKCQNLIFSKSIFIVKNHSNHSKNFFIE